MRSSYSGETKTRYSSGYAVCCMGKLNSRSGGFQLHALIQSMIDFGSWDFWAKEGLVEALFLPTSLGDFSDTFLHKPSIELSRLCRLVPAPLPLSKFLLPSVG